MARAPQVVCVGSSTGSGTGKQQPLLNNATMLNAAITTQILDDGRFIMLSEPPLAAVDLLRGLLTESSNSLCLSVPALLRKHTQSCRPSFQHSLVIPFL